MRPLEVYWLREAILHFYERDSCVVSVKCTLDYLEAIGESGKPMQVELGVIDTSNKKVVDIGTLNPDPQYVGHVVVVTDTHLIDPSLDQVNDRGLSVPLFASMLPWTENPPSWKEDNKRCFLELGGPANWYYGPILMRYMARPGDKRYTTSPNWGRRDEKIRKQIVGEILRNRDKILAAQAELDEKQKTEPNALV